jgi:hypothetical protein
LGGWYGLSQLSAGEHLALNEFTDMMEDKIRAVIILTMIAAFFLLAFAVAMVVDIVSFYADKDTYAMV